MKTVWIVTMLGFGGHFSEVFSTEKEAKSHCLDWLRVNLERETLDCLDFANSSIWNTFLMYRETLLEKLDAGDVEGSIRAFNDGNSYGVANRFSFSLQQKEVQELRRWLPSTAIYIENYKKKHGVSF